VKSETPSNVISIYSIRGELLQKLIPTGTEIEFVDISNLDAGTYIMQMESDGKFAQRKFVKF
jgi:hypothetical protein